MKLIFCIFILLLSADLFAQQNTKDSLLVIINRNSGDSNEVNAISSLTDESLPFDSMVNFARRGLAISERLNYKKGEAHCYFLLSNAYFNTNNFSKGIEYALSALNIYKHINDIPDELKVYFPLQGTYRDIGDYKKSLEYAFSGLKIAEAYNLKGTGFFDGNRMAPFLLAEIGQTYLLMNKLDSALYYTEQAINSKAIVHGAEWNFPVYLVATIYLKQKKYEDALQNYRSAIPLAVQNGFFRDTLQIFSGISTLFLKINELDSSIYYASLVVWSAEPDRETRPWLDALSNLSAAYKLKHNEDSALKYTELKYSVKDSLFDREKDRQIQSIAFNELLNEKDLLAAHERYKIKIQLYASIAALLILLLIATILWRSNIHKQQAKTEIEKAYHELRTTQAQLIQSEKMASLGELTAGIAHEIQNPLNFVNNFSEVSSELVHEMKQELATGNLQPATEIANDIEQNLEKIIHHGKRADAIVKGMLQHTRTSTGQKEPTDINALCDEYLRLSYHGMRAKDKNFNATLKTDFDENIGKINVIPQDIGRVLLNLYNNAFYAVAEKLKAHSSQLKADSRQYVPTVAIVTKKINDKILISVKRQRPRHSSNIVDKIFQPFFTTKPTGEGTGLGLSLSYDIIKAHGGEISAGSGGKVETKDGEGCEFMIWLPVI
jgi:signal transduction histidine kinase